MIKIQRKKIIVILLFFMFLMINVQVTSEKRSFKSNNDKIEIIIKIGNKEYGQNIEYINVTYDQIQRITEKLTNLKQKLNQDIIDQYDYFNEFLEIFQAEKILSEKLSLDLILEIYDDIFFNQISKQEDIKLLGDVKNKCKNIDEEIPFHIGRRTIIASIGIGNYLVKRIIPIRPYRFIDVINKEILRRYNLTSTFSYALACMWTPGPSGYHLLYSLIPVHGFENYSYKIFNDKSIGGIFILGMNISLEAYSKDGTKVYFDATIGIYGADLMIGF